MCYRPLHPDNGAFIAARYTVVVVEAFPMETFVARWIVLFGWSIPLSLSPSLFLSLSPSLFLSLSTIVSKDDRLERANGCRSMGFRCAGIYLEKGEVAFLDDRPSTGMVEVMFEMLSEVGAESRNKMFLLGNRYCMLYFYSVSKLRT